MSRELRLAVVGVGRIGLFHARHLIELAEERGDCRLVAVADRHERTAADVAERLVRSGAEPIASFTSPEALVESGIADAAIVASRTADHLRDTRTLVEGGLRVMLEKPLASTFDEAEAFGAWLDADTARSRSVMLAFQRRYDPAMLRAEALLREGAIGELFKIMSALEDPGPPPQGYESSGLLVDMGVHNADEIVWLAGRTPTAVAGFGGRVHNQRIEGVAAEEHDDAFVQIWLGDDVVAQLQVSRNHVAGYRNECVLLGREGRIHVGHFEGDAGRVRLEAYGPDHTRIEQRWFDLRDWNEPVPPFIQRFEPAYMAEAADFVQRCIDGSPFSVTHREGLIAMRVVSAGAEAIATGTRVELS
mgnify:CR=1 FL=1